MKMYSLFACAALTSLGACASLDSGPTASEQYAAAAPSGFMQIAFAPQPPNFCEAVAASDSFRAANAGFDAPTVARLTLQSLRQCSMLVAMNPGAPAMETLRIASR